MAELTSAWEYFSSFANTDFGNNVAWSNLANFDEDDSVLALVSIPSSNLISKYATATDWNGKQSISPDSVINGIEARYTLWRTAGFGGSREYSIRLVSNGSVIGTDHSVGTLYGTSEVQYSTGSVSDTWGITPNTSHIKDGTFGVVLAVQASPTGGVELSGDYIQMRITHSPGAMMICM